MPAMSSESTKLTALGGVSYGSKSSTYRSIGPRSCASRSRNSSMSGSGPASGSQRSVGTTSPIAPSRPPAKSSCDTSSSSIETAPPGCSPRATSRTAITKLSTWSAISAAKSLRSSPGRSSTGSDIELPPALERTAERHFVGVFKIPADGQATRKAGHPQSHRLDQPRQVGRGRFAFEVGVGRQDQFGDRPVSEPSHELAHPQIVGPDAFDRADRAAENVVAPAEFPGLLDSDDVLRLLDHANHAQIAPRIAADPALGLLGHVAADRAEPHLVLHLEQDLSQPADVGCIGREQVERDPLRALRPDVGQLAQLINEVLNDAFVHSALQAQAGDAAADAA